MSQGADGWRATGCWPVQCLVGPGGLVPTALPQGCTVYPVAVLHRLPRPHQCPVGGAGSPPPPSAGCAAGRGDGCARSCAVDTGLGGQEAAVWAVAQR